VTGAKELVRRYKTEYPSDPSRWSISASTRTNQSITLRPLQAAGEHVSDRDIERLTVWRNDNSRYFLTDFIATPERTRNWVISAAGPDLSRILFLLDTPDGETFGHVGLCSIDEDKSYCELDNIVRGNGGPKGAMAAAVDALTRWTTEALGLKHLWVRVIADNPAVSFYERLGFQFVKDVPLVRHADGPNGWRWHEVGDPVVGAERYLRYMALR
jgi:RimJ/RimL family protein N-acetyltransferase